MEIFMRLFSFKQLSALCLFLITSNAVALPPAPGDFRELTLGRICYNDGSCTSQAIMRFQFNTQVSTTYVLKKLVPGTSNYTKVASRTVNPANTQAGGIDWTYHEVAVGEGDILNYAACAYSAQGATSCDCDDDPLAPLCAPGDSPTYVLRQLVVPGIPQPPFGFTVSQASASEVRLSWFQDSSDEEGFELQRATGLAGPFQTIALPPKDATSWVDTSVSSGQIYYYRIRAFNMGPGVGAWSPTAMASSPQPTPSLAMRPATLLVLLAHKGAQIPLDGVHALCDQTSPDSLVSFVKRWYIKEAGKYGLSGRAPFNKVACSTEQVQIPANLRTTTYVVGLDGNLCAVPLNMNGVMNYLNTTASPTTISEVSAASVVSLVYYSGIFSNLNGLGVALMGNKFNFITTGMKPGLVTTAGPADYFPAFTEVGQNQQMGFLIAHESLHNLGAIDLYSPTNPMPDQTCSRDPQNGYPIDGHDIMCARLPVSSYEKPGYFSFWPSTPGLNLEPYTAKITGIRVVHTFEDWKTAYFSQAELNDASISGEKADPDNDLVSNLEEYAFDGNPIVADGALIKPVVGIQNLYFTMAYRRRKDALDLTYEVVVSPVMNRDLSTWVGNNTSSLNGPVTEQIDAVDNNLTTSTVVVRDLTRINTVPSRFMALKITHTAMPVVGGGAGVGLSSAGLAFPRFGPATFGLALKDPSHGGVVQQSVIELKPDIQSGNRAAIRQVEYLVNGQVVATSTQEPFIVSWSPPADQLGATFQARLTSVYGQIALSPVLTLNIQRKTSLDYGSAIVKLLDPRLEPLSVPKTLRVRLGTATVNSSPKMRFPVIPAGGTLFSISDIPHFKKTVWYCADEVPGVECLPSDEAFMLGSQEMTSCSRQECSAKVAVKKDTITRIYVQLTPEVRTTSARSGAMIAGGSLGLAQ